MIKFGWKRDLPDFRDFQYAMHAEVTAAPPLPHSCDLRKLMSPVEDQGSLGSCVAHSVTGVLEFLELGCLTHHRDDCDQAYGKTFQDISRLFIYWNARTLDGDNQKDNGTQIRTAIKAVRTFGACQENVWPYIEKRVFQVPTSDAFADGVQHKVVKAFRIDNSDINEMKMCLVNGFPFAFGVSIYTSFMSQSTADAAVIPMPKWDERMLGGHAMCCVGYDDGKGAFLVRNSWGEKWGDHGYCWMPYGYLNRTDLCSDCWTIRDE